MAELFKKSEVDVCKMELINLIVDTNMSVVLEALQRQTIKK